MCALVDNPWRLVFTPGVGGYTPLSGCVCPHNSMDQGHGGSEVSPLRLSERAQSSDPLPSDTPMAKVRSLGIREEGERLQEGAVPQVEHLPAPTTKRPVITRRSRWWSILERVVRQAITQPDEGGVM